ncbi:MAG: hypothetical protein MZV70_39300 [Desulfobacterales bacterium]|nr:hypothetical protein [Desulfobacterales bacterium]
MNDYNLVKSYVADERQFPAGILNTKSWNPPQRARDDLYYQYRSSYRLNSTRFTAIAGQSGKAVIS